jgi:signal peptidase II
MNPDTLPDRTRTDRSRSLLPFSLTALVIAADQITKALVVTNLDQYETGFSAFGDFFRLIHVRNPGVAFSLGRSLPEPVRRVLFIVVPLAILAVLTVYYLRTDELNRFQRWIAAGLMGGGLGNIIDRIARPAGVVDFLDFKFYGIFGLERWPTFNIADMSVVVCGILLAISFMFEGKRSRNE